MEQFEGKVAVVTGAASGIGFALAEAWLREGCRVVMADIEVPALDAAHGRLDPDARERAITVRTDVSDAQSVEALAATTLEAFGQVDIVCNNAGVSTFNTFEHQTLADWQWVLGVNLWGVIHGVHTFVPIMRRQGTEAHIVNTASIAGLLSGVAYIGPYAATKVAVVSISETLRQELAIEGSPIGVSCAVPERDQHRVHGGRAQPSSGDGSGAAHRRSRAVARRDQGRHDRSRREGARRGRRHGGCRGTRQPLLGDLTR